MINQIWSVWKVEMLLLWRKRWILLVFGVCWLYIVLGFPEHIISIDPGRALMGSVYLVVAGMLASLIYGWHQIQHEKDVFVDEVIHSLPQGWKMKLIGKVLSLITVITLFLIGAYLILLFRFAYAGVPEVFWEKALLYILLYWFLPFLVAGLWGMVVGIYSQTKLAYVYLLILCFFISPLVSSAVFTFSQGSGIGKQVATALTSFNIGQSYLGTPFDPIYGLPMEWYRWSKAFLLAMMAILLLTLRYIKQQRATGWILWTWSGAILSISLLLSLFLFQSDQTRPEEGKLDLLFEENEYYLQNPSLQIKDQTPFIIPSYHLKVKSFRQLVVEAQLEIKPTKKGEDFVFTLYHGFRIREVLGKEDQVLPFIQKGDQIQITVPHSVQADEIYPVKLTYEGTGPFLFFANEQAVYLPNYFPWTPVAGAHNVFLAKDGYAGNYLPVISNEKATYKVEYQGPSPLFTHLPQTEDGIWSGESIEGITLLSGMVEQSKIGKTTVYYPQSMYRMAGLDQYLKDLEGMRAQIEQDFGSSQLSKEFPEHLFMVSIPNGEERPIFSFSQQWHMGLNNQYFSNTPDFLSGKNAWWGPILRAAHREERIAKQPEYLTDFYYNSYLYWDAIRNNDQLKKQEANRIFQIYINSSEDFIQQDSSRTQKQLEQLRSFIEKNSKLESEMKQFFRTWRQRLREEKPMNMKELEQMVKEGVQHG
ncbi:hypothetical protein [Hazenella coriacea]|uniref:ABC-type transport system involved in multi-copper enzyme maturation permease subunit n=1 Tax=Hazenella coriacea TaxID=1179467 RepID=A0A4R3LEV3_9BACL|nr:hypothetical protein [Hazenella coriacea]TCS96884.1 hypothetical protein EDD58_101529 [Hazenella coriacea]